MDVFRFTCLILPYMIMCVNSTRVEGNRIKATLLSKHTECRTILNSVENSSLGSLERGLIKHTSKESLKARIKKYQLTQKEEQRVADLIESEVNLVVYLKIEMIVAFDDISKKITSFHLDNRMASVMEAPAI